MPEVRWFVPWTSWLIVSRPSFEEGVKPIDIERKNRLLKVCYVPAINATFLAFFLAVAINSTNEANMAGGMRR